MKKKLSQLAEKISSSKTLEIDALYKKLKSEGKDVISFGAGEPDFKTPQNIKNSVLEALELDMTKYTAVSGDINLKKAIKSRLHTDLSIDYKPDEIVVTSGAKHVIYTALMCILNPSDEVIIPAPYWVSYIEMTKQSRGIPVVINCKETENFKLTLSQLIKYVTPKTKALFLNNPSNPTGMLYTKEELLEIAIFCKKHNIYVIADEIYYKLVYDNKKMVSFGSLGDEFKDITILIHGVSKSYCMTGFRIGYALCNKTLANLMSNYLSHSTSCACSIAQFASTEALNGDQTQVNLMINEFEKRRDYMYEEINKIDGVSCIKPDGAFYIMMNIKNLIGKKVSGVTITSSEDFAKIFLENKLVATVPSESFGVNHYLRWSYSTSLDEIKLGLNRLKEFIKEM